VMKLDGKSARLFKVWPVDRVKDIVWAGLPKCCIDHARVKPRISHGTGALRRLRSWWQDDVENPGTA